MIQYSHSSGSEKIGTLETGLEPQNIVIVTGEGEGAGF